VDHGDDMDVIVLGGAGEMGSRAVRDLAADPELGRLTIADADLDRAGVLAESLRRDGAEVDAVRVDADDHSELVSAMRGHDAAAGAIGPFYRYEAPVARAAIEARVPYVSLCDDYDAAKDVLALDGAARSAGVSVVTGMGWTPGISNILARRAAERLDAVEALAVAWGSSAADSEGFAVIMHTVHIFTGRVPSFRGGEEVLVEAGGGRRRVRFPDPVGEISVFDLGHPEPVTLPRFLGGVDEVSLKGGLSEASLNSLARLLARARLTDTPAKKLRLAKAIKLAMPVLSRLGRPPEPCSAVRVDVRGRLAGEERTISYGVADHMDRLTGIPLAIGARMLACGQIDAPGVAAPEAVVEPDSFLAELQERGIVALEMAQDRPLVADPTP
jgi:lysine 6-dehydrogenase